MLKFIFINSFLLSCCFCELLKAQEHSILSGGVNKQDYCITMPFKFEQGCIIIYPEIAGKKRKFILDTGVPTSINHNLAQELKPPFLFKSPIVDGFNHIDTIPIVGINEIKFDDVSFENIPAIVSSPFFHACAGVEGMIGSNLLQNSVVQILFKEKKIIISNNKNNHNLKNTYITDLYLGDYKNPYLLITINDSIIDEVLFDTGAGEFYTISEKIFNNFKSDFDSTAITNGYGANGYGVNGIENATKKQRLKLKILKFCGTNFKNVCTIPANCDGSRIGVFMLKHGDVTIDYINAKFYFKSYKKTVDKEEKHWNLSPVFYKEKCIVGVTWGEASTETKFGDEIIEINKEKVNYTSFCDFRLNNPFNKKQKHQLLIKTADNQLKMIEMIKK